MISKYRDILISIGIIILLIGIDQITKIVAFKYLSYGSTYKVIPGLFKMQLVNNSGAAFGILSGKMWLFHIITIAALFMFCYLMKDVSFNKAPIYTVALTMIVSGTIGNFIDRVLRGSVRDFLTFDFMNFAVFNFADMCLTIGVILLIIDYLFGVTGTLWTKNS